MTDNLENDDADIAGGPYQQLLRDLQLNQTLLYQQNAQLQSMQVQLRASEARFRATVEASPVPNALVDGERDIAHLNAAFINLLGYTRDDIPTLDDWWINAYPDPVYRAETSARWARDMTMAQLDGTPFAPREVRIQCKDGSTRLAMVSASRLGDVVKDMLLVTLYDVTEQKRAERELRDAEERFRLAFDLNPDSMTINRVADGSVVAVNRAYTELSGYSAAEALGSTALKLNRWAEPEARNEYIERLRRDGSVNNLNVRFRAKDGKIIEGLLSAQTFANQGELYYIGTVRNVTQQRQAEHLLRENEEKFKKAFDLNPDAMSLHRLDDGVHIAINGGFTRLTGYTVEQAVGNTALSLQTWVDPPLRQNSCRLDRIYDLGAMMGERVGSIRTGFQRQSGRTVAAAGECAGGSRCGRGWRGGEYAGAVAGGGPVQARSRAGLDSGGSIRRGGDGGRHG